MSSDFVVRLNGRYYSTCNLARELGLTPRRIRQLIADDTLKVKYVGELVLIPATQTEIRKRLT